MASYENNAFIPYLSIELLIDEKDSQYMLSIVNTQQNTRHCVDHVYGYHPHFDIVAYFGHIYLLQSHGQELYVKAEDRIEPDDDDQPYAIPSANIYRVYLAGAMDFVGKWPNAEYLRETEYPSGQLVATIARGRAAQIFKHFLGLCSSVGSFGNIHLYNNTILILFVHN